MLKISKRSKHPKATDGPRVGAFLTRNGVEIRVIDAGETPALKAATVVANDDARSSVVAAAQAVAARIARHARKDVRVEILV